MTNIEARRTKRRPKPEYRNRFSHSHSNCILSILHSNTLSRTAGGAAQWEEKKIIKNVREGSIRSKIPCFLRENGKGKIHRFRTPPKNKRKTAFGPEGSIRKRVKTERF